ncbi:MAG TPA: hypothetical protein PKY25_03040 [Bacilli bacterium]|nr:hypothetical protein [Bacilli bacterium]
MKEINFVSKINMPKKKIYKRWWFWTIVLFFVISTIFLITNSINKKIEIKDKTSESENSKDKDKNDIYEFHWPDKDVKYITAVPIDLEQIQSISKYRSCAGHIRDGYSYEGDLENDRSMKHYFLPIPELQGTLDKVKLYAPFDGTITKIDYEKDKVIPERPNNGGGLHFVSDIDPNAEVIYGHIYTSKDYKVGDKVKAGEFVGYAAVGQKGNDFDIDLSTPGGTGAYKGREVLGSVFDHMTSEVLKAFAKYDITPENTKFTKEYRDANPCNYYTTGPTQAQEEESRILLKGRVPEADEKTKILK